MQNTDIEYLVFLSNCIITFINTTVFRTGYLNFAKETDILLKTNKDIFLKQQSTISLFIFTVLMFFSSKIYYQGQRDESILLLCIQIIFGIIIFFSFKIIKKQLIKKYRNVN